MGKDPATPTDGFCPGQNPIDSDGDDRSDDSGGSDADSDEESDEDEANKISKRKLREMIRPTVAELKRRVKRPDLVEAHDVTAFDPDFLIEVRTSSFVFFYLFVGCVDFTLRLVQACKHIVY